MKQGYPSCTSTQATGMGWYEATMLQGSYFDGVGIQAGTPEQVNAAKDALDRVDFLEKQLDELLTERARVYYAGASIGLNCGEQLRANVATEKARRWEQYREQEGRNRTPEDKAPTAEQECYACNWDDCHSELAGEGPYAHTCKAKGKP